MIAHPAPARHGNGGILGNMFYVVDGIGHQGLIYLGPPYDQHRHYANYHVWETLVRWDEPGR